MRLGEVCEKPQYGYTASAEDREVGPKLLRITDIQNGEVNWDRVPFCRCDTEIDKYLLKSGDILIARTGGTTGKSYHITEVPSKTIFASYLIRVRTGSDLIPEYLYQFLQSDIYWQQVALNMRGGAQPNMNATLISRLILPLPPFPEQKRIASKIQELMQEVERARAACEKQLEAAKALPAAYLREVFESEEAKKWEKKKLGEVCEVIMGQSPPSNSYNKDKIGLPFFQGKADFGDYFPLPQIWCSSPMKTADLNDVLISVRAPVGPINMADQHSCIGRGLAALRNKGQIDAWFLFFYFKSIENNWKGRGSTFDAIRKDDLVSMFIPFPHDLPEQQRIAAELKEKMTQAENLQSAILNQQSALNALPQAILRKAFRGEL